MLPLESEAGAVHHVPLAYSGKDVYLTSYKLPTTSNTSKREVRAGDVLLKAKTSGRPFFLAYLKATFSNLFIALSTSNEGPPFRGSARENKDPCQSSK